MRKLQLSIALAAVIGLLPDISSAKGCLKGAAVGGVVGHVAAHHAVLGAAAGCVIGHHRAQVRERQATPAAPQSVAKPAVPGGAPST